MNLKYAALDWKLISAPSRFIIDWYHIDPFGTA